MDFNLSDEERALQDTARKFAREVMRPKSAHHDEHSLFPREIIRQAAHTPLRGKIPWTGRGMPSSPASL